MLLFSCEGPSSIAGGENLRILQEFFHLQKLSFPSEESEGLAGLNLDPFFFVLKMCIYLIN